MLSSDVLQEYLEKYDLAIDLISKKKGKCQLIELDEWLWKDLKKDVYRRYKKNPLDGYYLTKSELSDIMKWKLMRGKFRPLQQMVDSNSEDFIRECTGKALNILCNNSSKWKEALKELVLLKGIGIATASIILAIFSPECLFMSDEVIKLYYPKMLYTVPVYKNIQSNIIKEINLLDDNWNAEMYGKPVR